MAKRVAKSKSSKTAAGAKRKVAKPAKAKATSKPGKKSSPRNQKVVKSGWGVFTPVFTHPHHAVVGGVDQWEIYGLQGGGVGSISIDVTAKDSNNTDAEKVKVLVVQDLAAFQQLTSTPDVNASDLNGPDANGHFTGAPSTTANGFLDDTKLLSRENNLNDLATALVAVWAGKFDQGLMQDVFDAPVAQKFFYAIAH